MLCRASGALLGSDRCRGYALRFALVAGFLPFAVMTADASFEPPQPFEVGGDIGPDAELVDDLNGDGIDDIVVSLENKPMVMLGIGKQ